MKLRVSPCFSRPAPMQRSADSTASGGKAEPRISLMRPLVTRMGAGGAAGVRQSMASEIFTPRPQSFKMSSVARREAVQAASGSVPRSKRWEASDFRRKACEVRRTVGGSKVGALQEGPFGLLRHPRVAAAHDARDGHGLLLVGDDEAALGQGVFLLVQGHDLLAGLGEADDDAAVQLVRVEGVHGLAHVHEQVVGDVDQSVDGAQAHGLRAWRLSQPGLEPTRQAFEGAADVARAGLRRLHLQAAAGDGSGRDCGRGLLPQGDAEIGGELPRQAQVREAVRPVGRELDFEDVVGLAQACGRRPGPRGAPGP